MGSETDSILARLDSLPQVKAFDAFPKTQPLYTSRSSRGGIFTVLVAIVLTWLAWAEFSSYLYGHPTASFGVDHELGSEMQVNIDMTVAMKCHYLTVDVRDAVGDRLHFSDTDITKDETTFEIGHAGRLDSIPMAERPIGDLIDAARHFSMPKFSRKSKPKRKALGYGNKQVAFAPTEHLVKDGDACRIYGSVLLKKVPGNIHITSLGHGYWSWEHTPHNLMNLSHVIHEYSFGPYFPDISQPLDHSVEISHDHFAVFQYFLNIVPTKYIDSRGRKISTNQYSVTDYTRTIQHGMGVPGIFFKFELEPLSLTMRQRTATLTGFLIRLAGIIGGVWVCAGYTLRVGDKAAKTAMKVYKGGNDDDYADQFTSAYSSSRSGRRGVGAGGSFSQSIYNSPSKHSSNQQPHHPYGSGSPMARSPSNSNWSTVGPDDSIASTSSKVGEAFAAARDRAGQAWQAGMSSLGPKHRKTESLQQKMMSEEGRAW
ncbi:unnamed protein product [Sympodiomycopsis kandeliae]